MTLGRCRSAGLCAGAILLASAGVLWAQRGTPSAQSPPATTRFFPVAVWYGGGKARAPMLDRQARAKKETWRKDVRQIKALGFNTVRAWIDWASGRAGRRPLRLRDARRAAGARRRRRTQAGPAGLHGLGAASGSASKLPGFAVRLLERPGDSSPSPRRATAAIIRACARRTTRSTPRWRTRARRSPAFLGWDLWSEPHVINWANPTWIPNPGVLLLPTHHSPLPWLASGEVRLARETE